MKTYIGEIDYPNEALACEENKDAFILSIGFEDPPPNKNGNFSTFFWSNWAPKIDFSYKPMRMPIIAKFWNLILAFFEAKMTKIDILNLKLIVPDD